MPNRRRKASDKIGSSYRVLPSKRNRDASQYGRHGGSGQGTRVACHNFGKPLCLCNDKDKEAEAKLRRWIRVRRTQIYKYCHCYFLSAKTGCRLRSICCTAMKVAKAVCHRSDSRQRSRLKHKAVPSPTVSDEPASAQIRHDEA